MNTIEIATKGMFPDWKEIKEGEWSKFVKSLNACTYLGMLNGFNCVGLDLKIRKICFEEIKSLLFMEGYNAISDFLGYDFPEDEDKDVTDNRMDEVQISNEKLLDFCKKHNLDKDLMKLNFEVGLFHETDNDGSDEEYRNTFTLQAFCGYNSLDNVIFCEKAF